MVRNFHPERTDERGLQKNQRALEELLHKLFDRASGDELFVVLAGRSGGQTILQGVTLEGGVTINDLGEDVDFRVEGDTEPNLLFVDASTGRVGIGAVPSVRFHIEDAANVFARLKSASSGQVTLILEDANQDWRFGKGSDDTFTIADNTAATIPFRIVAGAPANAFYIDSAGQVGIGTNNPGEALEIVGTGTTRAKVKTTTGNAVFEMETNNSRFQFLGFGSAQQFSIFDALSSSTPFRILGDGSIGLNSGSFGSGAGVVSLGNAATRPSTAPTDASILSSEDAAAGQANLFAYNEDGQRVRLTGVDARVAADFNKTNATLANVTGLSFNVEAGKTYAFEARLLFTADATGGVQVGIGGTSTATAVRWRTRISGDGNPPSEFANTQVSLGASTSHFGAAVTVGLITVCGTITVNAAGTLTVTFAQQSASGTSTINRGSTFHLQEIT